MVEDGHGPVASSRGSQLMGRLSLAILATAFFLAPVNALRLRDVAAGDFLVLLAILAAPVTYGLRRLPRDTVPMWVWAASALLITSVLLGTAFSIGVGSPVYSELRDQGVPYSSSIVMGVRLLLACLLFPVAISVLSRSWDDINLLTLAWLAGVAVSCAAAVLDSALGTGVQVSLSYAPDVVRPFVEGGPWGVARQVGLTDHPNTLGLTAAMATPLALVRIGRVRGLLIFGPLSALLVTGVVISGSRSALLGLSVGVVAVTVLNFRGIIGGFDRFVGFVRRTSRWSGATWVTVLLVAVFLLIVSVGGLIAVAGTSPLNDLPGVNRLVGADEESTTVSDNDRLDKLNAALSGIAKRPLTGTGYQWIEMPHSLPLGLLLSGGLLALIGFAVAMGGYLYEGLRLRRPQLGRWNPLLTGVLASVFVFLSIAMVNNQVINRYLYLPMGLILAARLIWLLEQRRSES